MKHLCKVGISALLLSTISVLFAAGPAHCLTYVVTSLADNGGTGELRAAINASNAHAGSTITFGSRLAGTIDLSATLQALPVITVSTNIEGPGASRIAINGDGAYRPFTVYGPRATVEISGLTIEHGRDAGATGGGAILLTAGNLILSNCTLTENIATGSGGAISNYGTVTLNNCTFSNNKAYNGGAIYNYTYAGTEGTAVLTNCLIEDNSATINGGGIYDYSYSGTGGDSTFNKCVVLSNVAGGNGGGIYNYCYSGSGGSDIVTNCLVAKNTGIYGGGIYDYTYSGSGGTTVLTYGTLSDNKGVYLGGIYNYTYSGSGGKATLTDSILYGDTNAEIFGTVVAVYCDIQGGHAGKGNINANPLFVDPAGNEFSLVATRAFSKTDMSPCFRAGTPVSGVTTDIRGVERGDPPTIGAYEDSSIPW